MTYKHEDGRRARCPHCHVNPPVGPHWQCGDLNGPGCGHMFDTFLTRAMCPRCGRKFPLTQCLHCGQWAPIADYYEKT
ncbi:MAG TPA: hypothetical protein VKK79_26395 [Candidatus Lokiarchaeia archaeon]|nr:hypothetical protein [Candidatus Lokiarchaeia archaeon]